MLIRRMMIAAVLTVALGLPACATNKEPFEYQSDNEARQGRGVFTGEEGTWTIFRKPMPPEAQTAPAEETDQTQSGADSGEESRPAPAAPASD